MRNHVSKVLVGTATANVDSVDDLGPATCPAGAIIAFDFDTNGSLVAASKNIGFAYANTLGEPIVAGPIPKAGITSAILNPYKAAVNKVMTLTVTAVPTVGKTAIVKVSYHDNLSIIPNQVKQTTIAVTADATNAASTTTWAAALAVEFNKQVDGGNLFVSVAPSTNTIVFTGLTITTASNFNGIDRPEHVNFEIGYPDVPEQGVYTIALTTALSLGQGDPAKVAWVESNAIGRQGFSDRRMWNDTKKFQSNVDTTETYANLVITADIEVEGDMQGTRKNPIGAVLFGDGAALTAVLTDLATAGITPETVAAG